ncbi:uncharacterized protein LOC125177549 [Hyalella azteca]|uniref:ATP-dependent DNA helicase n=1 Tax=Hyalella azteca TaxID=294128 RepID=A0A979FQ00_HYAAZ|nr:uncharacterized protein LOC125177549 [Hyalella azteca]
MAPKKKPKRRRCSYCNLLGHYTEDCHQGADRDVAAMSSDSATATSPTSQISESPSRDGPTSGQCMMMNTSAHGKAGCSSHEEDVAVPSTSATSAAGDRAHGQRASSRNTVYHETGYPSRGVDVSYADTAGTLCARSTHLSLSPPKKRLKRGHPEFATVSVPVTATTADDSVSGQRATGRASVRTEAGCSSREVDPLPADSIGPSGSTSTDLTMMGPKKKPRRKQCLSCGQFGHYMQDCHQGADHDVAAVNSESAPGTPQTSQISESPSRDGPTSGQCMTMNTSAHGKAGCSSREEDVAVPSTSAVRDLPLSPPKKRLKRGHPEFAIVSVPVMATSATGTRSKSRTSVHIKEDCTSQVIDASSTDVGPSCSTSSDLPSKLVEILPRTIKESYRLLVPRLSVGMAAVWQCPPKCVDATQELHQFKTDLLKHAGLLASKLNETCFPSVKCPMGCNTYIDGDVGKDVDYLPLHHYLSLLCPKFSSFKSDPNFFSGKRPDWPSRGKHEGFKYAATLIVDSKKGLCIVTCSKKIHADGRSLYIHVPCNPVLGSTSELRPDLIAPLSANPHFVRAGRTNEFNTSHAVFREYGDSSGASSFSLTPKPYVGGPCTLPQIDSMGLTFNQRPDIYQSLMEGETLPNNLLEELKDSYDKQPLDEETIRKARETGTYVNVHDASNMLMNFNSRLATGHREETHQQLKAKGKEVLQIAHPGNNVGRLPFRDVPTTYVDPPLNGVPLPVLDATDDEVVDAAGMHILEDPPPLFPEEVDDVAEIYATPLDSLAGHDPNYLAFCFDVYLNSLLQSNSVSVALRKGLEHVNRAYVVPERQECSLKFDEADSRREVQRLSAMMSENPWDFFVTLTCNDSGTMGVAPLRKALEERYHGKELDKKLQNACPLLCRAWARSVRYLFEFLMHGEEKIFGELKNVWYRFEFQNAGSPGNKPHVHAGLTLKDRSRNDNERLKRVHNNLLDMFNDVNRTDFESLVNDGLVKDRADFVELVNLADRLTQHNCSKSGFKCMKITSKDGSKRCRVPRYLSSAEPKYLEHTHMYDVDTQERLMKLGLGKRRYPPELDHLTELHNDVVVEPTLVGGRYNYAGEPGVRRVPSNGRIFAMLRSMVNVQVCDLKFTTSYLAKYAAGADEKREVVITSSGDDDNAVDVEPRDLYHAKISGSKIAQKVKMRAEKAKEALCREITAPEMIWFTHQLPFVVCSAEFVHCSTHAPEHRQAVYRKQGGYIQKLINEDGTLKATTLRAGFPSWRRFTRTQTLLMSEIVNSPYFVDNTSLFSVRPPELRKVMKLGDYLKWFSFTRAKVMTVSEEISECPWIDGSGKLVRVRKRYVDDVRRFFETLANQAHPLPGTMEMHGLFEALHHEVLQGSNSIFVNRFVDMTADKDVVVVFTCIEPTSTHKFLVHLLLTLGSFVTELQIFRGPTLLHAFQYAQLIADVNNPTEEEALSIIRLYVMTQLSSLPYGVKAFSRHLGIAMDALLNFFFTRGVEYVEVPLASLRAIREDATTKLQEMEAARAQTLASVLETTGIKNSPTAALLSSMRKFDFVPEIERLPEQSRSSYAEQLLCLHALVDAIDRFDRVGPVFVPCPLIVGPPGAGKTHLLLTACVYALSKGLRTIITAATAERARSLGGEHLHLLFAMPTVKSQIESVPVTAQKCLLNLCASPVKMAYLKRLDVLVIEEIGLLPASLLNIIDFVLRQLRESAAPFGGVLLLCCGDPCQLKPVKGRSIWLMPNLFTMFKVLGLKHFVRSRGDPQLQTLIKRIRKPRLNAGDVEESLAIIRNRCVPHQFVNTWQEVPDDHQRVVGKNSAVEYAVSIYLEQKKATPGLRYIIEHAHDEIEVIGGNWMNASAAISKQLDKECKEPHEILLFCRQIVRLTYNNSAPTARIPKFSQGQLAVLLELPDLNLPRHAQRITIKLVPPGVRVVSVDALPNEWPVFAIARRFTIPQKIQVHMSKARREQWPFTYFVCTTVHRSIGETLPKLATQISEDNSMFRLWDKNQLLVILSRVQSLDDLLFVGNADDTLRSMKKLIEVVDPWQAFVDKVLTACDSIRQGDGLLPQTVSYPSILSSVPSTESGFVFMLVSLKFDSFVIDNGPSLKEALREYNDPLTRSETRSRRPWILASYTTCFSDNTAILDFTRAWRARIHRHHGLEATCHQALETGRLVFQEEKLVEGQLIMQQCVKLTAGDF